MLIKEFRVTLPMTVEEYQVAQLYCVAEASKDNTGGGEGIEVLKNEPFENFPLLDGMYSKGQYTHKIYHIASKVPAFIRMLLPKGSLEIHEEAWNAYPYCRTVLTNPLFMKESFRLCVETLHVNDRGESNNNPGYMKENFVIMIESLHIDDVGQQENVHKLPAEKLKNRGVVHIDIANDEVSSQHYKKDQDPKLFQSVKTGRGPLVAPKWQENCTPVMTCYKLVTVEFKWFGLQTKVESFIQKTEQQLFLNFHRLVFCSMDKWHGLTMADIRALEEKTKLELDKSRNQGEVRGMKTDAE